MAADPDAERFVVRRVVRRRSDDGARDRVESRDETDEGWGEPSARRDADWYERERPPHHG